jgi:hypothetical protein
MLNAKEGSCQYVYQIMPQKTLNISWDSPLKIYKNFREKSDEMYR